MESSKLLKFGSGINNELIKVHYSEISNSNSSFPMKVLPEFSLNVIRLVLG